jgi:hypothetical protein
MIQKERAARSDGKYWVEHQTQGHAGWLVDAEDADKPVMPPFPGQILVRLDRGQGQVITKPYTGREGNWRPRATANPMSEMAKTKVAYAALRAYALGVGDYRMGRQEFESITPEEKRIELMRKGPVALDPEAAGDIRQELWDAVMAVLNQ